ncbi:MAG: hypothetical protein Q7R71_00710 [bacterium]|nr:hypothetical protein [bacterium]
MDYVSQSVLQSKVNGFLALLFVGSFTLAAWLIVWYAVFGENPIANAMAVQLNSIQNY